MFYRWRYRNLDSSISNYNSTIFFWKFVGAFDKLILNNESADGGIYFDMFIVIQRFSVLKIHLKLNNFVFTDCLVISFNILIFTAWTFSYFGFFSIQMFMKG